MRIDLRAEMRIGDDDVDVTEDVRIADAVVSHRWGRADEASQPDPATAGLTLNNRDGVYSVYNPLGPYWGTLGRNTPLRLTNHTGSVHCATGETGHISTPDHPALRITGDLDVRLSLGTWAWRPGQNIGLAGRWQTTGNQRSWMLTLTAAGHPQLRWSTNGSTTLTATAALPVPILAGKRGALRAALDVDTGAGWAVTFWIRRPREPWRRLGEPVSGSGATSVHAGTADLCVGIMPAAGIDGRPLRIMAVELLDGIDGTAVADLDLTTAESGAPEVVDAAGRTWSPQAGAEITRRRVVHAGEIVELPPRWDRTGQDRYVPITSAGLLRRLQTPSRTPPRSALRRYMADRAHAQVVYWPMTEGAQSEAGRPAVGTALLRVVQAGWHSAPARPEWGRGELAPWLEPVMNVPAEGLVVLSAPVTVTGQRTVEYVRQGPGGTVRLILTDRADPPREWVLLISTGDGGSVVLLSGVDGLLMPVHVTLGDQRALTNEPHLIRLTVGQGSSTPWQIHIDGQLVASGTASVATTVLARVGMEVVTAGDPETNGAVSIGHLVVWQGAGPAPAETWGAVRGWEGEKAGRRVVRICGEQSIPLTVVGDPDNTQPVGPQQLQPPVTVMRQAVEVDDALLMDARHELGLLLRTRASMDNQPPALVLDASAGHLAQEPEPTADDQLTVNRAVVARIDGGEAEYEQTEGRLGTQDPPLGMGLKERGWELNAWSDSQLLDLAAARVAAGTVDELRWPKITLHLHDDRLADLVDDVLELLPGDRATLVGVDGAPPGVIELAIDGATEAATSREWRVDLTCRPGSPHVVGQVTWDDPQPEDPPSHIDTDGSRLALLAGPDATTLWVEPAPPAELDWIVTGSPQSVPEDVPVDVLVGGEVVTVTNIGAPVTGGPWAAAAGNTDIIGANDQVAPSVTAAEPGLLVCAWATYAIPVEYTIPAGMTGLGQAAGYYASATVAVENVPAGPTGTRTATADFVDAYGAISVVAPGASVALTNWVRAYEELPEDGLTLTAPAEVGDWLVAIHLADWDPNDEMARPDGGWEPVTESSGPTADAARVRVWARQASTSGAQEVVLSGGDQLTDVHGWLLVFAGVSAASGQPFTVIRARNGISKTHPAGTDVRLARPMLVAPGWDVDGVLGL
ncbi:hypothetical protein GCM10027160_28900 [Streptomyces calidiresistens]|uniref:Uncharacterized protein n=1 Tax=Streptomyces calidiresistens TaxID=1485586 RepID=A0A7W3T027_9ACTN|nr:hypothetical protein [Streptomyces calidiresistens]MBB0228509.1 hypothetical protein [Streptomyces calidiresistens]